MYAKELLVDAYKINLVKAKKNGTTFDIKYRSRKENKTLDLFKLFI